MRHFLAVYRFYTDLSQQQLHDCLELLQKSPFKEEEDKKFVKVKNLNNEDLFGVYGHLEYGVGGYGMPVYDYNNDIQTKTIEPDECPVKHYFFLFHFSEEESGILITERIGNVGIRKALVEAINNVCGNNSIQANPVMFGVGDLLNNGRLKKFILKVRTFPKEIEEKLKTETIKNSTEELEREIVLSAKRNKFIEGIIDWFRTQFMNRRASEIAELIKEEFGEDVEQVKLVINVNDSQRTLVFSNGLKFRSWLEIDRGPLDLREQIIIRKTKCREVIELINNEGIIEIED